MTGILPLATFDWTALLGTTPLEIIATLCSVLGVFLIARQNILGWPLGLVWAGISTYLCFTEWNLVSDGILYLTYIPIQIYCWVVWVRRGGQPEEKPFLPTWLPLRVRTIVIAAALLSILGWGLGVSSLAAHVAWIPTPALLWRDSTTTVLNYYAQFLQARKRMENWIFWVVVNVLGIHIYWVKGSPIYSAQYAFFLVLGLYGWLAWHRSRAAQLKAAQGSGTTGVAVALLAVALTSSTALAAESSDANTDRAVTQPKFSTALTLGYDSRYTLYGFGLSRHLYHADSYSTYALSDRTTLWGGAWFGYLTDGTYRELDGYVGVDYALRETVIAGAAVSFFRYFEVPFTDKDSDEELSTYLTYRTERLQLSIRDHLSDLARGHLLRGLASYTQPLNDRVSAELKAEYGYAFRYYITDNRPQYALFRANLPVRVTDTLYATPFILHTLALSAIDEYERDRTIGGLSFTWLF